MAAEDLTVEELKSILTDNDIEVGPLHLSSAL